MKNYHGAKKYLFDLTAQSITACITSLLGQLQDYEHLDVTQEQAEHLYRIYEELNKLVKEIIHS